MTNNDIKEIVKEIMLVLAGKGLITSSKLELGIVKGISDEVLKIVQRERLNEKTFKI